MMLSGEPSGDLIRRSSRRAASSPIWRAADGDCGQRRPVHGALRDVVEADDGRVTAGNETQIGETQHDAERAEVVMADHGRRRARFVAEELADRSGSALSRRKAIDDRPDRQSESRQDGAEGLGSVARGRHPAGAADKGDALVPKSDQMLRGQGHAEPEVGADVIRACRPTRRNICTTGMPLRFSSSTTSAEVPFGRGEQDAVDPVLAHAGDEASSGG